MRVVISQPMYFPWPGHMEQVASADVYVFYDDVQFTPRSFIHRVQIKCSKKTEWLTVALRQRSQREMINRLCIGSVADTAHNHIDRFLRHYANAPYSRDAVSLMERVFALESVTLDALCEHSTRAICQYMGINNTRFAKSSLLAIPGASSERLLAICKHFGANEYVTGHGAMNYLNHEAFDAAGIQVLYADYSLSEYPQLGEGFTPYVSTLDLIAMMGPEARAFIRPRLVPWREFVARRTKEPTPK
jgi:hypothetical protein